MTGLNYTGRSVEWHYLTISALSPPSHGSRSQAGENKAPTSGRGVSRGYPASPSRPRPRTVSSALLLPPAGVALPAASGSGGGGGSSRGWSLFSAAAGWIVSIKVFFLARSLARSLSSGEQAEASIRSRRVRKRRTRSERKRPPAVSSAPHGPAAEKKEPSFGRAASAGRRHLPASLAPARAPPRGLVGCPRGSAAREPCCPGGLATREGPAAPPGGSGP